MAHLDALQGTGWDFPRMPEKFPACVLVVDDEPLIRWSLAETLSELGCEVIEAGDRKTALARLADGAAEVDVVLLDLRLPDSHDLGLLADVRRVVPRARVILMTAFGAPDVLRRAEELGAFRVIGKPFEIQDLVGLIRQAHDASRL